MHKFRKKPVVVDAIKFTGNNYGEVIQFIALTGGGEQGVALKDGLLCIDTLEGVMTALPGDWIIRGVKGELYPCKPDVFAETYETVGWNAQAWTDSRRLAQVAITYEFLLQMLQTGRKICLSVLEGIPEDAQIVRVDEDPTASTMYLLLRSRLFDPLIEGSVYPRINVRLGEYPLPSSEST